MNPILILTGPTAVGKSSLAIQFAIDFANNMANSMAKKNQKKIEIINADSVCFYQHFNIGSAKPSPEEQKKIPHHLIDIAQPNDDYHAGDFLRDCNRTLKEIENRKNETLIVGGSGFYLKALRFGLWDAPATSPEFRALHQNTELQILFEQLEKIDPLHAKKIGANDRYRIIRALEIYELSQKKPSELEAQMSSEPDPRFQLWTLDRPKDVLEIRIRERVETMLEQGLREEVKELQKNFPQSKVLNAIGYRQVIDFDAGVQPKGRKTKLGPEGLIEEICLSHRQLAKQQRTWLRSMQPNESFMLDQDLETLKEKLMKLYQ